MRLYKAVVVASSRQIDDRAKKYIGQRAGQEVYAVVQNNADDNAKC